MRKMLTNIEIDTMHAIIRIANAIEEQNKLLAEIRDAVAKGGSE